ncbi:hypothetical protein KIN20_012372 [Parelaphostrongylus tenuis]|uniref:Mos1 transposase HTH domain-containing protein n=1 Tax=Parelaphostrongylus tenuis TaxID=148309 RepID=A0AAD5MC25_PARTN|nr:hypothetical protein KIN20_012372 [Parelaphostrongylus tenuis]
MEGDNFLETLACPTLSAELRVAVDGIHEVEGEGTTSESALGCWFQRFSAGDVDLKDKPRSGCPTKLNNEDQMFAAWKNELSSSACALRNILLLKIFSLYSKHGNGCIDVEGGDNCRITNNGKMVWNEKKLIGRALESEAMPKAIDVLRKIFRIALPKTVTMTNDNGQSTRIDDSEEDDTRRNIGRISVCDSHRQPCSNGTTTRRDDREKKKRMENNHEMIASQVDRNIVN